MGIENCLIVSLLNNDAIGYEQGKVTESIKGFNDTNRSEDIHHMGPALS